MSTNRVRLTVAYDGTDFCGFAAQTGHRTVQGTLKEAVRRVSGEEIEIEGASRTDSGAHALGQVCHFDTTMAVQCNWVRALNDIMPKDVRVTKHEIVEGDFSSRFWARDRVYQYKLIMCMTDPFRNRFACDIPWELDVEKMQNAAAMLQGRHDFRAFTEELPPHINNTWRKLFSVKVRQVKDEVNIDVRGTAFLRGMMRRMSGCLLEIGRGKRDLEDMKVLLSEDRDSLEWPVVLPARGLTLIRVHYGRHPKDNRKKTALDNEE